MDFFIKSFEKRFINKLNFRPVSFSENCVINLTVRMASGHGSFKEIRKLDGFNEMVKLEARQKSNIIIKNVFVIFPSSFLSRIATLSEDG